MMLLLAAEMLVSVFILYVMQYEPTKDAGVGIFLTAIMSLLCIKDKTPKISVFMKFR